jgi:hypothetical protein
MVRQDVNILKKEAAAPNKTQLKAFSTPAEGSTAPRNSEPED